MFQDFNLLPGLATVGMLLIALVAVGGFTVLAQRRLRSLGMLGALGATDRNIRLVVRANGVVVGVVGTVAAYVAAIGYAWDNPLDGLSELSSVPTENLLFIVVGMPVIAAVVGWLLAGREPPAISRQPLE